MAYRVVLPLIDVGNGISPSSGAKLYFYDVGTATPKTTYSDFSLSTPNTHPVNAGPDGVFGDIFLADKADVSLHDGDNVLVYGPKTIYAPDDSVVALAASGVVVTDAAGYFTASQVEAVLAEIGLNFLNRDREETVNENMTFNSAELISPILKNFTVKHNAISSSAGTLTIDLSDGNSFSTTLTENITTMTVTGIPASGLVAFTLEVTQDGAGGAYTVAVPTGTITPSAYTASTGNDAVDDLTFRTRNGGTVWKLDYSKAYA